MKISKQKLGQTKFMTMVEAVANVGSGMVLAFTISQIASHYQEFIREYIWSSFIWTLGFEANVIMTIILTVVSVLRGYVWRRLFNKVHADKLHGMLVKEKVNEK